MQALRKDTPDYHLVDQPNGLTLCGLDVSAVRLKWKAAMSWIPDPLLEGLCEDCIKVSEPRPVSDNTLV